MLIALTAYERDRANKIEARSMVLPNREYRAIVEQDWQILNRELQLHLAKEQSENNQALVEGELIPNSPRRELANLVFRLDKSTRSSGPVIPSRLI